MAYLGAATSLVEQGRMRVPTAEWDRPDSTSALSLWPPGFPAAIALPTYLGVSAVQSARWINIVAAAVSAGAIVLLVAGVLGPSVGVIAALVVFATQAVFDTQLSVLSEPLFIAVMLLLLLAMVYARDRLILLGVLATAAVMVRYAGLAAPAAAATWTFIDARREARVRWRRTAAVVVLPLIATVAWFTRTAAAPDRHATPSLTVYGGWGATLAQARDTLAQWLAPLLPVGTVQRSLAALVAVALTVFIIAAASDATASRLRRLRVGGVSTLLGAASLLGLWYVLVVLASRAFVGGSIPMDWRILAPLIVLIEIMAVASVGYWWRAYHFPMRAAIVVVALTWLVAAATVTANDAIYASTEGSDFAGARWRKSPLIAWVRAHAAGRPLYSNWPSALYFHAHRVARELPDSSDPGDVSGFAARLAADRGYVVGFDEPSPDFISPVALAGRIGLRQVVRTPDGAVWAAEPAAPSGSAPDSAMKLRQ
jgi:dolichyl-phosphate-mannose-protein mannosyltransferase